MKVYLINGLCIIVAITAITYGTYHFWEVWQLNKQGLETTGIIKNKNKFHRRKSGWTYSINYEFEAEGIEYHKKVQNLYGVEWKKLYVGQPIQILYLSDNPHKNKISNNPYEILEFICFISFVLAVSLLFYIAYKKSHRNPQNFKREHLIILGLSNVVAVSFLVAFALLAYLSTLDGIHLLFILSGFFFLLSLSIIIILIWTTIRTVNLYRRGIAAKARNIGVENSFWKGKRYICEYYDAQGQKHIFKLGVKMQTNYKAPNNIEYVAPVPERKEFGIIYDPKQPTKAALTYAEEVD